MSPKNVHDNLYESSYCNSLDIHKQSICISDMLAMLDCE